MQKIHYIYYELYRSLRLSNITYDLIRLLAQLEEILFEKGKYNSGEVLLIIDRIKKQLKNDISKKEALNDLYKITDKMIDLVEPYPIYITKGV